MGRRTIKETSSFRATADDGREFTIHEFTEFLEISSRAGTEVQPAMRKLKTSQGYSVNPLGNKKYEILDLGKLVVTTTDPNAPE